MIITVTMNPAIDRTINLEELNVGGLNRVEKPVESAGGKGINVTNSVKAIGGTSVAMGFLGSMGSDVINECLDELSKVGIKSDFVTVQGRTRTNIKLVEKSGRLTEINESGFTVGEHDVSCLVNNLSSYANEKTIFVLSGSAPIGVSTDIYRELTEKLKEMGAYVIVDSSGEYLRNAVAAKPDVIKPNEKELLDFFDDKNVSERTIINRAKELVNKGVGLVIVSRGEKGSLFVTAESVIKCNAVAVDVVSTVGAGDAMVGAYAYGIDSGLSYKDSIKLAVAAASAATLTNDPYVVDGTLVNEFLKQVELKEI